MSRVRCGDAAIALLVVAAAAACSSPAPDKSAFSRRERAPYLDTDTMGLVPQGTLQIRVQARPILVENSGAAISHTQPGVFFTINDSGNEPILFALDTTGADRGVWRVNGATNRDWEAVSVGPCLPGKAEACVYIGDVGDNEGERPSRVIYRVAEPRARQAGFTGDVVASSLRYRYADGPHDVEAMYVAPTGDTYLITKRRLRNAAGAMRPSLVFVLPATAWQTGDAVAELVDSLSIIPGSAPLRTITDAALSPDSRYLAVRTYAQVYVFATDSTTGRVNGSIPPTICNTAALLRWASEGITWFGQSSRLLLTNEGNDSPMFAIDCPMPRGGE